MLTMAQICDVRKAFFMKGKNASEISREFKVDRKTVRKYIQQDDWNAKVKTGGAKRAFPKLDSFEADIYGWLEDDKKATRKQRHTAKKIYMRLKKKYEKLLSLCDDGMQQRRYRHKSPRCLFDKDRLNMLKLPETPYEVANYTTVKTNAYTKFSLNAGRHLYSTSPRCANSRLLIKITAHNTIALDEDGRQVASHRMSHGPKFQESTDQSPYPYIVQLFRRPRALKYSGVYEMLPHVFNKYLDGCCKTTLGKALKAFVLFCFKAGFEVAVKVVVAKATLSKAQNIDSLMAIHSRTMDMTPQLEAVRIPEGTSNLVALCPDNKKYDNAFLKSSIDI